ALIEQLLQLDREPAATVDLLTAYREGQPRRLGLLEPQLAAALDQRRVAGVALPTGAQIVDALEREPLPQPVGVHPAPHRQDALGNGLAVQPGSPARADIADQ